ncbi:TIGR01777 family oxidoreductase [Ectobacillus antri]|uniref:TIGR01777 family oxidoreductase n=1 Tax=Ectobacillus antri TaxID=2486280 RepID=A0ABT6H720_9BACI|nr:TIGR01777 family oxidoreductase [Ectobacillus antri]MDG4657226.1 TIGR01777 family oxidoreductase [Ectobacillus antri]MDG5754422.1 TIGR01777 family oxidoreductase [Ectobacillus antri]
MKIAISGGTGFIGKALATHLISRGHAVFVLTRSDRTAHDGITYVKWNAADNLFPLPAVDAVINLAGESLNSGRWTETKKQQILNSRLSTTQGILRQLASLSERPKIFINASAIGYYGTSLTQTFTELDKPGQDFLATTVELWEKEARKAEELGMRTVLARFGIVLGAGGALSKIILPYRLFAGGTVGSGKQWLSWVHIDDVTNMISFCLNHQDISGPVNITAPHPVTMKEFGKTIAKIIHRPHWLPAPALALKLTLGEMSILVLEGQKALPQKAIEHGYTHTYKDLEIALSTILS